MESGTERVRRSISFELHLFTLARAILCSSAHVQTYAVTIPSQVFFNLRLASRARMMGMAKFELGAPGRVLFLRGVALGTRLL